jgi:GNAT superfamily N-acetyltransferase
MDIRVATLADAHILADLNADFNGVQMTLERMAEQMLRCYDVERALIACIDGTAVGFACLRLIPWLCYDPPYAELTELFVREPFRRRGIASALVAHAQRMARAAGAKELRILTGRDNPAARAFYRKLGCTEEDEVLLILHLV